MSPPLVSSWPFIVNSSAGVIIEIIDGRVEGGLGWWTRTNLQRFNIGGWEKDRRSDKQQLQRLPSPDLAVDVCQACVSPAPGPPPCTPREPASERASERRLHPRVPPPGEEGTGGWNGDPPGAESATLTSARKRSLELASQLPGDLILSFFLKKNLKSCS